MPRITASAEARPGIDDAAEHMRRQLLPAGKGVLRKPRQPLLRGMDRRHGHRRRANQRHGRDQRRKDQDTLTACQDIFRPRHSADKKPCCARKNRQDDKGVPAKARHSQQDEQAECVCPSSSHRPGRLSQQNGNHACNPGNRQAEETEALQGCKQEIHEEKRGVARPGLIPAKYGQL